MNNGMFENAINILIAEYIRETGYAFKAREDNDNSLLENARGKRSGILLALGLLGVAGTPQGPTRF